MLGDNAIVDLSDLSDYEFRSSIFAYVVNDGWNWQLQRHVLSPHICAKIAGTRAPSASSDDFSVWHFSTDGVFSIKLAYEMLFKESDSSLPNALFTTL